MFAMKTKLKLLLANAALAILLGYIAASPAATAAGPCDPPIANPVVCENSKPGNPASEWDINGAGDFSIQGFATEMSVNLGETVSFKVQTDASNYRIDIYRLGYYNGAGARLVASVEPSASLPQSQPACLSDPSTGLVDCGNWAVSASWSVPSTAVSGIHIAKLVRESGGSGASHIPFVVRDDNGGSDVLFQTSDTTWQAYNAYGGNSLYTGNPAGRAYKVSYNRPFWTRQGVCCVGSIQSYLFSAEYPMVRWLERNGYDVSYSSGIDTDRRGAELLEHDVFLSVGHDEYWSGQQRANVEAARNAGVNLAFFSGNEVFWKTRWENSIDGSGTPYRTLVVYKESLSGAKIDPNPAWTGTWRDPRLSPPSDGGRPENALTGTIFMVNGPSRNDPIDIPAADGKMRIWRNTSIASLPDGGVASLPAGVLGFEWDEDLDNGHRPPGLVRMSKTTLLVGTYLLDYANTFGGGTATHRLTMYKHNSGAVVFGAGTVQWSWGLDPVHDTAPCCSGPASGDPRMQQATVNILADMNVQAGTLQAGLVQTTASTDSTAPTASITSPLDGTVVNGSTVIAGTASDLGGGRIGGVEVSLDNGATWHPAEGRENWTYTWNPASIGTVVVRARAVDDSLNLGAASPSIAITSTAATASFDDLLSGRPLDSVYPAGQIDWGTGQWYVSGPFGELTTNNVSFTESLTSASLTFIVPRRFVSLQAYNGGTLASTVTVACEGNLTRTLNLAPGEIATLNLLWTGPCATATLTSTNGWETNFDNFVFDDAGLPPDTTAPTISNVQATASGTRASITWTTDETSDTQVEYGPTEAYGSSTTLNTAFVTGHTATISGLTLGQEYHFRVRSADPSGNVAYSGDFTVTADCPCTMWDNSATPAVPAAPDTVPIEVGVKFQSETAGFITGIRFYKGATNTGTHVGHLWTATGDLLAQATFYNETATGWQQVSFPAPVPIAANTTYVASYYAPNGGFPYTRPYFTAEYNASPLRGLEDVVSGGNGVFRWGSPGFPASTFQASNYWVDVVYEVTAVDDVAPVIDALTPAESAANVSAGTVVTATFSEPVTPGSVVFELRDAANALVPATVSVNGALATLDPDVVLGFNTTYTATLSAATDTAGNALAAPRTWSFSTGGPATSIWAPSVIPTIQSQSDTAAIELGMKFRSDVDGFIQGVRFYKGALNTGAHTGNLWTSSGQLLATAAFANETASGWQEVLFSAPVAVTANTTYVVSYHAPNGGYALNQGYLLSDIVNFPLRALADGVDGPNGLYRYGSSAFPDQSFAASNYWVDVVFATAGSDTAPPALTSRSPAPGATKVAPMVNVTATFGESISLASLTFTLRDAQNALVPAAVTYDAGTRTATLNPNSDLAEGATYSATIGAADLSDNVMSPVTWTFTISECPCTLWDASTTPTLAAQNDPAAIELGVKFRSDIDGYITGMRFYKGAGNDGTHTGTLWTAGGTPLASATFTNETASGWQEVTFAPSVAITAGTTYIASYHAPNGRYSLDIGYFLSERAAWPLRGLETFSSGGNGLYAYTAAPGFPTNTFNGSNYWVDVVFSMTPGDTTPPTVTASTPANGATSVGVGTDVTVTFDEAINAASLGFELRDGSNSVVPASVSYSGATLTATLDPAASLASHTEYTATVSGARDLAGNTMAGSHTWSFTTGDGTPPAVTAQSPAPGATGVSGTANVTATFSEAVQAGSISFVLRDSANAVVPAVMSYSSTTLVATLNPTPTLASAGVYTATVTATDLAGNAMTSPAVWSFTITDTTPPQVTSRVPSPGATGVGGTDNITATFNEPVQPGTISFVLRTSGGSTVSSVVTYDSATRTATLNPNITLASSATYTATLSGARDLAGNQMTSTSWSFTIADTVAPTVIGRSPGINQTGVSRTANIVVRFSEPISPSSSIVITLVESNGDDVSGVLTYDSGTRRATFNPDPTLRRNTWHTVTVSGARDAAGNVMSTVTWQFRTRN